MMTEKDKMTSFDEANERYVLVDDVANCLWLTTQRRYIRISESDKIEILNYINFS